MSIPVVIGSTTYNCPNQGQNPAWGNDLSDIIQALAAVANNVQGPGDILSTTFPVANNVVSASNITGLAFNSSVVQGAIVQYSIYRTSSTPSEVAETGVILLSYKPVANTWIFSQTTNGFSGITFSITNAGQFQYTSSDIGSTGYSSNMVFNAKGFIT